MEPSTQTVSIHPCRRRFASVQTAAPLGSGGRGRRRWRVHPPRHSRPVRWLDRQPASGLWPWPWSGSRRSWRIQAKRLWPRSSAIWTVPPSCTASRRMAGRFAIQMGSDAARQNCREARARCARHQRGPGRAGQITTRSPTWAEPARLPSTFIHYRVTAIASRSCGMALRGSFLSDVETPVSAPRHPPR